MLPCRKAQQAAATPTVGLLKQSPVVYLPADLQDLVLLQRLHARQLAALLLPLLLIPFPERLPLPQVQNLTAAQAVLG
jgi:hypothetical protein